MSKMQRDKGIRGEREVRNILEDAGFEVRGLEGEGDNLALFRGWMFHVETKRQETIVIEKWCRQAESEHPDGCLPLVVWRRSRQPWRVTLTLEDLLKLIV